MNLYLVNQEVQKVIDQCMDYDTGEITEDGFQRLETLGFNKDQIIHEMILSIKNAQSVIDGIDTEIIRLQVRKQIQVKIQDSIKKQLLPALEVGKKITKPEYELKWTTSKPLVGLEDYDPELEYANSKSPLQKYVKKKETVEYSFDKNAIKEALKSETNELPMEVFVDEKKNLKIN